MPPRQEISLFAFQNAVRRGAWKKAMSMAAPELSHLLPEDLTVFYGFVGEEDMLADNPYRPALSRKILARILGALKTLEAGSAPYWALKSYALICADRYEDAEKAAVKALQYGTSASIELLRALSIWLSGNQKRNWKRVGEALLAVERAVLGGRDDREALLLRAQIRLENGRHEDGAADLKAILRKNPNDDSTRLGLVDALSDMRRYDEAERHMRRIFRRQRGNWWACAQLGRVQGLRGDLEPALENFNKAIDLKKGHGPLHAWRAEVLRRLGRLDEAQKDLDAAVKLEPRYGLSWEWRGRLRLIRGLPERALRDLEKACKIDPTHIFAHAWRAEARIKTGRLKQAWEDLAHLGELNLRTTWNSRAQEGRLPTKQEREQAFLREIAALSKRYPTNPLAALIQRKLLSHGNNAEN